MLNSKVLFYISLVFIMGCTEASHKFEAIPHKIHAAKVTSVESSVSLSILGKVTRAEPGLSHGKVPAHFTIEVILPKGIEAKVNVGDKLDVTLPILHHQNVKGTVSESKTGAISVALTGLVQALDGESIHVSVPIKSQGLFQVPFRAIYSPRGITTEVFVIEQDKVRLVEVKVIHKLDKGQVLIAAALENSSEVVVAGLDNLVNGDSVRPITEKEL